MRAEEFICLIDQDEIKRIADSIGADIKIYPISKDIRTNYMMDWIRIDIQFLGVYSHIDVLANVYDFVSKDVMNDNIKRLIFSKLLDTCRDYLSSVFNFSE